MKFLILFAAFGMTPFLFVAEQEDQNIYLCTCQQPLTGPSAEQYIYLVEGDNAKACRDEQASTNYTGYREYRIANEGRTWAVEGRTEISADKAQRTGLKLRNVEVSAVPAAEFPDLVRAYYPGW